MTRRERSGELRGITVRTRALVVIAMLLVSAGCGSSPSPRPASPSPGSELEVAGPNPIEVAGAAGRKMAVTVENVDALSGWRSATRDELRAVDGALADRDIALVELATGESLLLWVGSACDRSGTLRATPVEIVLEPGPRPGCDAIGNARGIVLTFVAGIDPAGLRPILRPDTVLSEGP